MQMKNIASSYTSRQHHNNQVRSESPVLKFKRVIGNSPNGKPFDVTSTYSSQRRKENRRYQKSFDQDDEETGEFDKEVGLYDSVPLLINQKQT